MSEASDLGASISIENVLHTSRTDLEMPIGVTCGTLCPFVPADCSIRCRRQLSARRYFRWTRKAKVCRGFARCRGSDSRSQYVESFVLPFDEMVESSLYLHRTPTVNYQKKGSCEPSKLKILVPSIGVFFTPLELEKAFYYQDNLRRISSRRFVAPSFNDVRLILNSAQILSLAHEGPLRLISFDGDLTLYNDGEALIASNPIIPRIIGLLQRGIKVAIVTAAGYTEVSQYHTRFHGLLEEINDLVLTSALPKDVTLIIVGGESNYLLMFNPNHVHYLSVIPREDWMLGEMQNWTSAAIKLVLDVAEQALEECIKTLNLHAEIVRKERAVGLMASRKAGAKAFSREQLEETVLVTQQKLELLDPGVPFCVFNGMLFPA